MKPCAKYLLFRLEAKFLLFLILAFPKFLAAQGTLNAVNISPGGSVMGYYPGGVGWSFVPTSDLLVTGISSTAPEVDFWLGTNQNIATYNYSGPYQSGQFVFDSGGPTNFQAVSYLLLSAGQTYFISTQQTNFSSSVIVFVYSLNPSESPYDPTTFSVSPYIAQFASYYLSSSGQWSSTTTPPDNSNYILIGPNFQFQVVPEPTSFEFLIVGIGLLVFRRKTD